MAILTGLDIIKLALEKARVLGVGDTLEDQEAQQSLDSLNLLLETLSLDRCGIYHEVQRTYPCVNGKVDYTIGPGGDFDQPTRPLKLWNAFTRLQSIDYPMSIITDASQYDSINNKFITVSYPNSVWYEQTYPLGTLHFYPAPSGGAFFLRFWEPLESFPTLTTAVALPVGYKSLLVWNLAEALCADFGIEPSAVVLRNAVSAKAAVKRYNYKALSMFSEAAYMSRDGNNRYNIMSDSYT